MRKDGLILYPYFDLSPEKEFDKIFNFRTITTNFRLKSPHSNLWHIWPYQHSFEYPKSMPKEDVMKNMFFRLMREQYFVLNMAKWPINLLDPQNGKPVVFLDEEDQRNEMDRIKEDYFGLDFMRKQKDFPEGPKIDIEPSK